MGNLFAVGNCDWSREREEEVWVFFGSFFVCRMKKKRKEERWMLGGRLVFGVEEAQAFVCWWNKRGEIGWDFVN